MENKVNINVNSTRKRVRNQLGKDTSSTVPIFSCTPNSFVDIEHYLAPVNLMTANDFAKNLFGNITCYLITLYFSSSLGNGQESGEEGELLTTRVEETGKTLLTTRFPKDYVPKRRKWINEKIEEVDKGHLRFARIYMHEGCNLVVGPNVILNNTSSQAILMLGAVTHNDRTKLMDICT